MRPSLLIAAVALAGCATDTTAAEARRLVARGALLVDVRTPEEFAERHIDGSINVPVETLKEHMHDALGAPRRPLVVYCHSGARAGFATIMLRKAGYQVFNLGSMARWYGHVSDDPPSF